MATVVTSNRPYDIIIFGASGFTGQFVVEEVARCAAEGSSGSFQWAVAGRSRERLEGVLTQAAGRLSMPELRTDIEIIVADVSNEESLGMMCQQGQVILNCVGPYRFYGEPVVKACIENGAHCIDISGEPQFLERMQLVYHSKALDKGVYVIGSCGFDSIPADMGILYTQKQFKGTLTAVESFFTVTTGPEGGVGHDATWQSAIYGFSDSHSLRQLRKKFGHKPMPVVGARVKKRGSVFFSKEIHQYAIPFMGSDPSVVKRTQRYLYEEEDHSPVQYSAYVGVGGLFAIFQRRSDLLAHGQIQPGQETPHYVSIVLLLWLVFQDWSNDEADGGHVFQPDVFWRGLLRGTRHLTGSPQRQDLHSGHRSRAWLCCHTNGYGPGSRDLVE